ncbi:glutathione S-transferase family protein [Neptuniibacter caesariensis]|uniref:Putative glutathione S-transferase n=1 Tax=Neptuniibacter caesariensis TaxID=207954 RepID=A0A7U8C537_NEPCE|nr:glutathione S-transferase family protein [Neptuniibacter caesariensis]EAR61740.1 putative glutathione S-transferase [Neptuniibacter caesariensis]
MELYIGNKNYSSWSLRGWLVLKAFDIEFDEVLLKLFSEEFYETLKGKTPALKVPTLIDGDVTVWDSLAICEYVNETYLNGKGWPASAADRARARAVVAEMHSGFMALRNEMPMNCRAKRKVSLSDEAVKDVQKIDALWADLRESFAGEGPWLFGKFSIADVFYASVVLRFGTYGINVSENSAQYMETVFGLPALQEWLEEALKEQDVVELDEAGVDIDPA